MGKSRTGWKDMRAARLAGPRHQKELAAVRAYQARPGYREARAAYMRETRAARRAAHVCVSCGREDAFYEKSRCPACMEREVIRKKRRRKHD